MDTKYFKAAFDEYIKHAGCEGHPIGSLTCAELSAILRRAQELKDAEKTTGQSV